MDRSASSDSQVRPSVLVGGLTGNAGGKEAFILSAFLLLKESYDFTFLVDRDDVAHEEYLVSEGAHIARVAARRRHPIKHLQEISRLVRRGNYQAVWLHQTVISSIEPLVMARTAGVPTRILHSHSSANMSGRVSGLLHRIQRPLVRFCANRRYACSEEAARWMFGRSTWTFVPNIFDPRSFSFDPERRSRTRQMLGLQTDETAVIHVARLGPAKNHVFDLRIMSALKSSGTRARLLLCGDGPYKEDLVARAGQEGLDDVIDFLGARSDVPDLLQAADVMILPSTFEGLPYTALEAQAAGLPLLLSQAVSESADAGGQVTVFDLEDGPEQWARAIARSNTSPASRKPNVIIGSPFDSAAALPRFSQLLEGDKEKSS